MPTIARLVLAASLCGFFAGAAALDANTATPDELETIRGIGPALSARIVEERSRRPFRDLDDLQARVRGVGEANLRAMRASGLAVGIAGTTPTVTGGPGAQRVVGGSAAGGSYAASGVQYFAGNPREATTPARPPGRDPARTRARGTPRSSR